MRSSALAPGTSDHGGQAAPVRAPRDRHAACLAGGCVWKRLARLEDEAPGFTHSGRLLRAYYRDLIGLCSCPPGHASRRI